ncbi:hypothetical protein Cgig2_012661 [Carnegiea gigantea]|uniref:BED-type domain-containing protein n=1 Tax=Carnegiea gigantea TaxID=171969 RepID=A0A9Q1JZN0_9CARY|nr:hypothetical protein Cgig2_012661 [Carnegiea gigantea]
MFFRGSGTDMLGGRDPSNYGQFVLISEITTMEDDYVPIDVDLKGDKEVAEIDSKHAKKTTSWLMVSLLSTKKLTSNVWEHYKFLEPSKDGNLFCKCKKYWQVYHGESKNGTRNLKSHLDICKKRNFRDIGQLLLNSRSSSLENRCADFDPEEFCKLMAACTVKHDLSLQICGYEGGRDLFSTLNPIFKDFDQYSNDVFKTVATSELKVYLEDTKLPRVQNYHAFGFCKENKSRILMFSQMARDILAIPLYAAASK